MTRLTAAFVSALLALPVLAQNPKPGPTRSGTPAKAAAKASPKADGIAGTLRVPDNASSPAEDAVRNLIAALQKKQAVALWDFLPLGWQRDLNGTVQTLATKVDPRLYDQSLELLRRTSKLLATKKQFILGTAMVKGMIAGREGDAGMVLDGVASLLDSVANSELRDHASLLTFDGRKFLDRTGRELLSQLMQIAAMGGDDPMKILAGMKVKTVEQAGDRVLLRFSAPGKPPATEQYQLVEGRWLPSDLVDKWTQSMPDVKRRLAALPDGGDKKQQAQARMALGMVEGVLKRFEEADTQAEFDAAVQALSGARGGLARPAPTGR